MKVSWTKVAFNQIVMIHRARTDICGRNDQPVVRRASRECATFYCWRGGVESPQLAGHVSRGCRVLAITGALDSYLLVDGSSSRFGLICDGLKM
jgi:hypothetical protein